jgi:hypothetical protein
MNKVRKLKNIIFTGTAKTVQVPMTEETTGEIIIADLYEIGGDFVQKISDDSVSGGSVGDIKDIPLDVTGVDVGNYGVKFYTEDTGVIGKTIVTIR